MPNHSCRIPKCTVPSARVPERTSPDNKKQRVRLHFFLPKKKCKILEDGFDFINCSKIHLLVSYWCPWKIISHETVTEYCNYFACKPIIYISSVQTAQLIILSFTEYACIINLSQIKNQNLTCAFLNSTLISTFQFSNLHNCGISHTNPALGN